MKKKPKLVLPNLIEKEFIPRLASAKLWIRFFEIEAERLRQQKA